MIVWLLTILLFVTPTVAFASVEDYETALMNPEQLYDYEYQPVYVVNEPLRVELDNESTTVDYVNSTLDSINVNPWINSAYHDMLGFIIQFFYMSGTPASRRYMVIVAAVGICFLYWGVRKVKQILWSAFKGKGIKI